MQILMYIPGMPFNDTWLQKNLSLGGSESAALFMARALAGLNHAVTVFTGCKEELDLKGLTYRYIGEKTENYPLGENWHKTVEQAHDVCIVQRVPIPFNGREKAGLRLWWLHDLALLRQRPYLDNSLPFIDRILCVSQFHSKQTAKIWEIDPDYITATQNGIDYDLVQKAMTGVNPAPKQLIFASRPERGLEELVKPGGIMEQLPDYTLHVCSYANQPAHLKNVYAGLEKRLAQMPNVINHGALGKHDLYRLMAACQACVYPTSFEDTSNITLLEANACGIPFIAKANLAALPETGCNGALCESYGHEEEIDGALFAQTIRTVCENEQEWLKWREKARQKRQSWHNIAQSWDTMFKELLAAKTKQSLALCMLVKNAADTLPLAVKSVSAVCNEIIIGVDDTTTDDTVAVCRALGAKVVPVKSPLETGFDAARNSVMEHAAADWLLWLDSDEIIDKPEFLPKYLQNSPVEAFAIPQHHLSTEPLGLLKTDYPARLFRNHRGFKYYGMIHEHPEKGLNRGLGRAVQITDAAIIHQGYFNESVRRKRFARNWPLMQKDRTKYPNRILGKTLWLRDLAHIIRYRCEMGQKPMATARAVINFWPEFMRDMPVQHLIEALPYYSEAVQYLYGQNAVEVKLGYTTAKSLLADKAAENIHGFFPTAKDAEEFLTRIIKAGLNLYDDKYF